MMTDRFRAIDEAFLLGDAERFWKLQLRQVRSARTSAQRLLAEIDLGEVDLAPDLREFCDQLRAGVRAMDVAEHAALAALADGDDVPPEAEQS
jgi:hypothetical protein